MLIIPGLTSAAKQKSNIVLPDGTLFSMTLEFSPMQFGWFIIDFTYNTFEVQGVRIVNSPNFFRQFKNKIPFGLACFSTDDREPMLQEDFLSKASKLYVLTAAEVAEYEAFLSGQAG